MIEYRYKGKVKNYSIKHLKDLKYSVSLGGIDIHYIDLENEEEG